MQTKNVHRLIVVFKTHLDIGFTGLATEVLKRYREEILPAAISLAKRVNTGGKKRFVWTVGSYLVKHCLEHADEKTRNDLAWAVLNGDIRYHALPFTTHTELMDAELFRYGLSIAKKLDSQFSLTTRAAKMTDVPGHTIAMVPLLKNAEVDYLHIGVNDSSRVPETPSLFRWRYGDSELVVNYAKSYGQSTILSNGAALHFCHGADNARPPLEFELDAIYKGLEKQYPNAEISSGTLDDFLPYIREVQSSLPVVTDEIGDTWIHGVATDPYKVSRYCRLLKLKDMWLKTGALQRETSAYESFMENLLLVAEHTWGMDAKKFLLDFQNWEKADFRRARKTDTTSYALFSGRNKPIFVALLPELRTYRGENESSSYSLFETSHLEQRTFVDEAVFALPDALKEEATHSFSFSKPIIRAGKAIYPNEQMCIGNSRILLGEHGELKILPEDNQGESATLGLFEYQTFDAKTVNDTLYANGRDMDKNWFWAECDFGKPGMEHCRNLKSGVWYGILDSASLYNDTLTVHLLGEKEASEEYGCPREIVITHTFEPRGISTELFWRGKDAIRSPEAIWLHFNPGVKGDWRYEKLGNPVSPQRVVNGGNRSLHCAQRIFCDKAEFISLDAPVVSAGEKSLYRVDDRLPNTADGFYYLLYNNRWGTNFKLWFEEDMRFSFYCSKSSKRL